MEKIGIFGGSFDPIHYGHLVLAEYAKNAWALDRVILVPVGRQPLKENGTLASGPDRLAMVRLAIKGNAAFSVDDRELKRPGLSSTVDTMTALHAAHPQAELFFITGADEALSLGRWMRSEELSRLCRVIAATRPGFDLRGLEQLPPYWQGRVLPIEIPQLEISSSDLRQRVADGKSIRYLLPDGVASYIRSHHLYRQGGLAPLNYLDHQEMIQRVMMLLSPKRYIHSVAVAELSSHWAELWGEDPQRAYAAGLLHDIAREMPYEELLAKADAYRIAVDPVIESSPDILHAEVAAAILRHEWNLQDEAILEAVARHTIPDIGMSTLAKIVFLSDVCEPNRRWWPGREKLLELCVRDLDGAMWYSLDQTLEYLQEKGKTPHPHTVQVMEQFHCRARENGGETDDR